MKMKGDKMNIELRWSNYEERLTMTDSVAFEL